MSYAVLSDETKKHLEQERVRLMNDRETIVSGIESSVGAEVDQAIQTLNALLKEAPKVEVAPVKDSVESVTELLDQAATETPTQPSRKTGTKKAKTEAKEKSSQPQAFVAKQLKRKFKGIGLSDAIVQVMQQDSARIYASDDLIAALYDKFDEADLPRARKTLGATLMHAIRAGKVEKVQDKPPHYKLSTPAT